MNRLCDVATTVNEDSVGIQDRRNVQQDNAIHVLLIGPVDFGSLVHDVLLDWPHSRLSIAPNYRELWVLPKHETIELVILHSTLPSLELEDATRFIRRWWSQARILVIRWSEGSLDDALYDDRVPPNAAPETLLATIEQLIGKRHERRSGNVEL
jgi:hypothetical protein